MKRVRNKVVNFTFGNRHQGKGGLFDELIGNMNIVCFFLFFQSRIFRLAPRRTHNVFRNWECLGGKAESRRDT